MYGLRPIKTEMPSWDPHALVIDWNVYGARPIKTEFSYQVIEMLVGAQHMQILRFSIY